MLNYLEKVQAGVDYIEVHLDHAFTLADVAEAACMSQWHFQRVFKALTNETLKAYIRSRRIANSMDALLRSEQTILDIALAAGFESHESYTRAFKKLFELSPSAYRKQAETSLILRKPQFDVHYLHNLINHVSTEPRIYRVPERHFVGIRTHIYGYESDKNNIASKLPALWDEFISRLSDVELSSKPTTCYGIVGQAETEEVVDGLFYTACVEVFVDDLQDGVVPKSMVPEGMVSMTLPAQQYAEFQHKGLFDIESVNETINYIYSSWLLRSSMRHTYAPDLEIYGPEFQYQSEDSIVYYAIPVEDL